MDARTSYFSNEIKDLQFKFKTLREDHETLKKEHKLLIDILLLNKDMEKQLTQLKEGKYASIYR